MKLTDRDLKLFMALEGEAFVDYLNRVIADVCDSRNWDEHTTKENANFAAKVIQDHLISKVRKQNAPGGVAYPYK